MKKVSYEDFVNRANTKHSNRYEYPEQDFKGTKSQVRIVCKTHGEFLQKAENHLQGKGCLHCGNKIKHRLSREQMLAKCREVHGDKFNYDFSETENTKDDVRIFCSKHQKSFKQSYEVHLRSKGCSKCSKESYTKNRTRGFEFFEREGKRFPHLDFSESEYRNAYTKIKYKCKEHGDLESLPDGISHSLYGCSHCGIKYSAVVRAKTTSEYVADSAAKWGSDFDYSQVAYKNCTTPIIVKCNRCSTIFETNPLKHLQRGSCQVCSESSGEKAVRKFLEKHSIVFETQKSFSDCKHKKPLRFDFYIPSRNLLIEFDGPQHHNAIDVFGGQEALEYTKKLDEIKNTWATESNLSLLRIRHDQDIEEVLTRKLRPVYHKIKSELSSVFPVGETFDIETDKFVLDIICFDQELDSTYLLEREKLTKKKYIPLFQSEWSKKDIVYSRLNNLLGSSNKIHARKTVVKEISSKEASQFLQENHLQGKIGGSHRLGLFYKDELVQVAIFGSLRLNLGAKAEPGKYELLRLCAKKDFTVVGGASKLFAAFLKFKPIQVKSYCDLRWGTGKLYESLGFKLEKRTRPNYFYTDGESLFNRFSFRKDVLVKQGQDKDKTEKQIMSELGYKRVHDLGHHSYTYNEPVNVLQNIHNRAERQRLPA